ncbi:hypothetical protein LEP1GSC073_1868 [Leptospira noguchii str. Cascata]|nr:hypothetical protein LEP1GSC073_1868 [Leptospira noguchii str. Cascata]
MSWKYYLHKPIINSYFFVWKKFKLKDFTVELCGSSHILFFTKKIINS